MIAKNLETKIICIFQVNEKKTYQKRKPIKGNPVKWNDNWNINFEQMNMAYCAKLIEDESNKKTV